MAKLKAKERREQNRLLADKETLTEDQQAFLLWEQNRDLQKQEELRRRKIRRDREYSS